MHSLLAKGRLLYTHDETIADLCARLHEIGERDTQTATAARAATHALPPIYKAHKWFITRGDLDYTALWILYAATPLAQIEVIGARLLADREVIPQAMKLNPAFFKIDLHRSAQHQEDARRTCRPRSTPSTAIWRSARPRCSGRCIDHLREVGEARSATEIEDHFKRNFGIEGVTTRLRISGRPGADRQGVASPSNSPRRATSTCRNWRSSTLREAPDEC